MANGIKVWVPCSGLTGEVIAVTAVHHLEFTGLGHGVVWFVLVVAERRQCVANNVLRYALRPALVERLDAAGILLAVLTRGEAVVEAALEYACLDAAQTTLRCDACFRAGLDPTTFIQGRARPADLRTTGKR
jgi:hypothetical protein